MSSNTRETRIGVADTEIDHAVLMLADLPHRQLKEYARHIEALGFNGIWYADERFHHEPYVGLAVIAAATRHVNLGPGVADPRSRHPALVAAAINSIAELSQGRAVLGLGAGNSGFKNLGLTRKRSATAMREAIAVIRGLLAGEEVTLDGEIISIRRARMEVETRFDVPICIAANGPLTLGLAGEIGDSVMIPHCRSAEFLRHKLRYVEDGATKAGRTELPRVILRLDTSVAPDRETAVRAAKVRLGRTLWSQYPTIEYLRVLGLELPAELDRRLREAGPFPYTFDLSAYERFTDAIPDELLDPVCLAGTTDDVANQIQELANAGVDEITILPVPPPEVSLSDMVGLYAVAAGLRPRRDAA